MNAFTVGSLFSGIGGFDLGFERAGFEIRWQVENDPFCQAVLAKHWPDVRRYDDIRAIGRGELERTDVVCGGFPCQDLSVAGRRAGINGPRSGLWRDLMRVVELQQPRGVLIENVHHAWRSWVPVVRRALWTVGYASLPLAVRASDFGAWHSRARVFLVAHVDPSILRLESWRRGWPFWTDPPLFADAASTGCQNREERGAEARIDGQRSAPPDLDAHGKLQPEGRLSELRRWPLYGAGWDIEPDVVRVVHGVSGRLDRRRAAGRIAALGNAVIPEVVEWIARTLVKVDAPVSPSGGHIIRTGDAVRLSVDQPRVSIRDRRSSS